MRNILDTLKDEHAELRHLFASMNATSDADTETREELLEQIEAVLIPHAKWEETRFYPAFLERADHEQQLLFARAITEHRAVEKSVLPDVHAADVDSRQFAGSSSVFGDLINQHAEEEETGMFKAMQQLFSTRELAELDAQYEDWKESGAADAMALYAKAKTGFKSVLSNPQSPG